MKLIDLESTVFLQEEKFISCEILTPEGMKIITHKSIHVDLLYITNMWKEIIFAVNGEFVSPANPQEGYKGSILQSAYLVIFDLG